MTDVLLPEFTDHLPSPRGPLSRDVVRTLQGRGSIGDAGATCEATGSIGNEDFQVALWMLQVTEVAGFDGVDDRVGGSLRVNDLRWYLRREFEGCLRELVPEPTTEDLAAFIDDLRLDAGASPIESSEVEVARLIAKSPYLAWEADPHTLALARVETSLKGAMADIQAGEYGVGFGDTHATIYRRCLDALGISLAEALDRAPAEAFAFANSAWLFGSDRRLRGAAIGQLCMLEMDSVSPCARAIAAWDHHELPAAARRWYDVHVLADEEHDQVIRGQLIPTLQTTTPDLVADAAWGAAVTNELLRQVGDAVMAATS